MNFYLVETGYIHDETTNVWSRLGYAGIAYNDGDEVEQRIAAIVEQASDITVLSTELRQHCTDWPSLYHLSGTRANILRPFETDLGGDILEIGAGCGAITRYLGECGGNILALEGSKRRATIARNRTKDLSNVTVVAEKFDDFAIEHQFDVITLIGVLEYANLFITGDHPAQVMLEHLKKKLKPTGKLIIAIENQLGLKYFAGAPEDHIGQPMYGIEGRYRKDQPETFGRKVLDDMLESVGFRSREFLAPFPDYKLSTSIITASGLESNEFDAAALILHSVRKDPQLPPILAFSPELAWPSLVKNGLAMDMANSFLIVAHCGNPKLQKNMLPLAWHYSTDRKKQYCKETIFVPHEDEKIEVYYKSLDASNIAITDDELLRFSVPDHAPYFKGELLSQEFTQIIIRDQWSLEEVVFFFKKYLSVLAKLNGRDSADFSIDTEINGEFFDCVPQNIIVKYDDDGYIIDDEWTLNRKVQVGFLVFRAILTLFFSLTRIGHPAKESGNTYGDFVLNVWRGLGWEGTRERLTDYAKFETDIQILVSGRRNLENYVLDFLQSPIGNFFNLNSTVIERDSRIANLSQVVTERDSQITNLNQAVSERDSQIAALYNSTSWRLTWPLRFVMHLVRATRTFKKAISYYGSPIVVLKKVVRIFRNEGVPGVLSRANILSEVMRTSVSHDVGNMMEGLYWPIPPADNDFLLKVSVIVPNYNHAPYLKRRLDSIYGQTYRNFEVILLDDCSTDESQNILCEYANRYKEITTVVFNSINSGGVFNQWHKGISLAHGDLIWIAESDDYCDITHLSELIRFFKNEAVMLSFCRSDFVKGDDGTKMWTSEEFLADTKLDIWGNEFIRSAHWVVNHAWGMKNIIPNVSSAIFRHPGAIPIMSDKSWRNMRLCGDWIFYLHLIRGGLVAYSPRTTNYYRQHGSGTSINTQKENTYYREHEKVVVGLLELYKIDPSILDRQQQSLYLHWCVSHGSNRKQEFEALYNLTRARSVAKPRTPNILMAGFALIAGGGETFPIMMANLLRKRGAGVSFLNCRNAQTDLGVRRMLNRSVPLFELDGLHRIGALCYDLGIEIIHSHHAWVDMTLAQCLMHEPKIKQVITMHGMYEMMPRDAINNIISLMEKRISRIIFTAEKNLAPFSKEFQERKKFTRINNALEIEEIYPIERSTLGIGEDDFVLCLVSRAIPEKGWVETIQAVELARLHCPRKICLLLIGEGEEFDRLKHKHASELTRFLGFRSNIRDYFAMADMGILPSRFKGESYPLVLIDCLLAGKPIIASRIGEIHEMLSADDSLAGELLELQNFSIPIENLANLIVRLASDSTYYQILKGRVPSAVKKFDPSIMIEKYEDIYRSVLIAE